MAPYHHKSDTFTDDDRDDCKTWAQVTDTKRILISRQIRWSSVRYCTLSWKMGWGEKHEKMKYFAGVSSLFGSIYHRDIMSKVNSIDGVTLTNANQTGIGLDLQSLDF